MINHKNHKTKKQAQIWKKKVCIWNLQEVQKETWCYDNVSNSQKIVENFKTFNTSTRKYVAQVTMKKIKWVEMHFKIDLHQKHIVQITLKMSHYVWQRHVFKASIKQGLKLTSPQQNLKFQKSAMSTNNWTSSLLKQWLKPWPNHSQVLACSYNQSSSQLAATLLESKTHPKHSAKSCWAITQRVIEQITTTLQQCLNNQDLEALTSCSNVTSDGNKTLARNNEGGEGHWGAWARWQRVLRSVSKVAIRGLWPLVLGGEESKPSMVWAASWSAQWLKSGKKRKIAALN